MNPVHRVLYECLMRGARGLAGYAAADLLQQEGETAQSAQGDSFAVWQNWLAARLEDLAAAAAAGRPELFALQVRAAATVLLSRGLDVDYLIAALQCLRAVLEKELPEDLRPTPRAYLDRGLAALDRSQAEVEEDPQLPDTPQGRLAAAYVLALLEGDFRRACNLVLDAAKDGLAVHEIYRTVLLPAQVEIGRMWAADEINVAEEHFTSATTRRLMTQLRPYAVYKPSNGKILVAAAVAGNQHDFGVQMLADFFEMDGWRVIFLGANVPVADLAEAVEFFAADLLGLSAARVTQLETLRQTIAAVRKAARGAQIKILAGGLGLVGAADLAAQLGADGYAADALEAVALGNRLVGRSDG